MLWCYGHWWNYLRNYAHFQGITITGVTNSYMWWWVYAMKSDECCYASWVLNRNKTWSLVLNFSLGSLQYRGSVFSHQRSSCNESCLPSKIVLHRSWYSFSGCLPFKVNFYSRSSSIEDNLPSWLPLKVVFHQSLASSKGHLPLKVVFHQRSSSSKGRSFKGIIHQRL